MSKNVVIVAVVVLFVIAGGWYLMRPKPVSYPSGQPQTQAQQTPTSTGSATTATSGATTNEEKNLVKIGSTGFLPQNITVKVGETVVWVNTDTENHTVNSAPHPTHTAYPPLNLGVVKPGSKVSLSFPKAGVYKYHDHLNPSLSGSITVQ